MLHDLPNNQELSSAHQHTLLLIANPVQHNPNMFLSDLLKTEKRVSLAKCSELVFRS